MKKVALHNLGCKVNAYETEAMQELLEKHGYEIVPFQEGADVYIINTCTVTNMADRKSRQMLHKARKMNPDSIVVACGCYVQAKKDDIPEGIDIVVGNNKKQNIVEILENYEKEKNQDGQRETSDEQEKETETYQEILDINHEKVYEDLHLSTAAEHTRAYIKVQDGCNQFCSYCIIPFARGRVRSRSRDSVLDEVKTLSANGYKEVVLTGIHLSSYGIEHMEGNPVSQGDWNHRELLALIREVHEISGLERIRLGSLEPRIITEEFAKSLAELPKFCPHFHLSLQSGCDSVLKRMNRHYTTEDYLRRCEILRKYFKRPAITTDVIVGFPGETEEEFDITEKYLEKVHFYEMHVFKYSRRAGTKAAAMPDQIPEQIKGVRSDRLLALEQKMSEEFRKGFIGEKVSVLFEEMITVDGKEYLVGHTPEYVKAALPKEECEKMHAASGVILEAEAKDLLTSDILLLKNTIAE